MARVVAQRVRSACVTVGDETVGRIDRGLALLVGIRRGDTAQGVDRLADKIAGLRIFEDEGGKMNLSAREAGGAMLVVSQFTLYADTRRGRRPSFVEAADPATGERLYEQFSARLQEHGYSVARGRFGARMVVALENDGPVTVILDSQDL